MVRSGFLRQQRARQLAADEERMLELASAPHGEYNQRLQNVSRRGFLTERGINARGMETTTIPGTIQARGWARFTQTPAQFHPGLVHEFYASMVPEVFQASGCVWVKNVQVVMTANAINEYLGTQTDPTWELDNGWPIADVFDQDKENLAAELRRDNQRVREHDLHTIVVNNSLPPVLAFWLIFITHNLVPSTHRTNVTIEPAKLLFALQNDLGFDVGSIILSQILRTGSSKRSLLGFPCLITHFCRRAGIDVDRDGAALADPMGDICSKAYNTFCTRNQLPNLPREEGRYRNRGQSAREQAQAQAQAQAQGQPEAQARRARRPQRQNLPEELAPWATHITENVNAIRVEQGAQRTVLEGVVVEQRRTNEIAESVRQDFDRRFFGQTFRRGHRNYVFGSSSGQAPDGGN